MSEVQMSEAAVLGCLREISDDLRGDYWYNSDELATAAQVPESVLEKAISHRIDWGGWQSLAMERSESIQITRGGKTTVYYRLLKPGPSHISANTMRSNQEREENERNRPELSS